MEANDGAVDREVSQIERRIVRLEAPVSFTLASFRRRASLFPVERFISDLFTADRETLIDESRHDRDRDPRAVEEVESPRRRAC